MSKIRAHSKLIVSKALGTKLILTAWLWVVSLCFAFAQNTDTEPYMDSWHKYRVEMGALTNSVVKWQLSIDGAAEITLLNNMNVGDGEIWVRLGTETEGTTNYAYVEVKFIDPRFDPDDPCVLYYSEYDATGGSGNCIAKRSLDIIVRTNNFYVYTQDDDEECNSYNNTIWDNNVEIDAVMGGTMNFTISMFKTDDHIVNEWSCKGSLSVTGPSYTLPGTFASLFNSYAGNSDYGTWVLTPGAGVHDFVITVTIDTEDAAYVQHHSDAVVIVVNVNGPVINEADITIQLSQGIAKSGSPYPVETDDNATHDKNQSRGILGLPATSYITIDR